MTIKPDDLQAGIEKTVDQIAKENPLAAYISTQPFGTIQASALTLADGIRRVVDRAGNERIAKGVRVNKTTIGDFDNTPATTTAAPPSSVTEVTSGVLCVHIVGDFDSTNVKQYTFFDLDAGDREGFVFDEILETGTTIDLDEVKILL